MIITDRHQSLASFYYETLYVLEKKLFSSKVVEIVQRLGLIKS